MYANYLSQYKFVIISVKIGINIIWIFEGISIETNYFMSITCASTKP